MNMAVETLGSLIAEKVAPANELERAQIRALAQQVQCVTGQQSGPCSGRWAARRYAESPIHQFSQPLRSR